MGIYTESRPWGKFEKFHENEKLDRQIDLC